MNFLYLPIKSMSPFDEETACLGWLLFDARPSRPKEFPLSILSCPAFPAVRSFDWFASLLWVPAIKESKCRYQVHDGLELNP